MAITKSHDATEAKISGNRFEVTVQDADNFSDKELQKLEKAVQLWEDVWNSDRFKALVLGFHYRANGKEVNEMRHAKKMNNQQVLEFILKGGERLDPKQDNEADVFLVLKRGSKGVLGWTHPKTKTQWINTLFFRSASIPAIVGNLSHEYCHKLGFTHEFKRHRLRQYSVPYAIGYITRDVAKELLGAN